ncbi:hypothetical protein F4805DRAFT_19687 [Annulohypoxylon moriforme]|nr:hypothetical protein F4805DRAFT_19687 [Annulohypoxylon moriforme]
MVFLDVLKDWQPFQLDALGLVTLFGAKEMNTAIGNLIQSWVTEWLPILGSYAVANDEIKSLEPGFVLYNVTDGIVATDVSAWFTRWLNSYPLTYASTTVTVTLDRGTVPALQRVYSMIIGFLTCGFLLIFAIVLKDWWGVANNAALCLTVLIRQQMVTELRSALDKTLDDLGADHGDEIKIYLTIPSGKAVTIRGPRKVIVKCMVTDPRPLNPKYYYFLRVAGWGTFGVHAISLSMTALVNQILSVVTLLVGTYLTGSHVGDCRGVIGNRLRLGVDLGDPSWTRSSAYARLDMSQAEENIMVSWGLMPQRLNTSWWKNYREMCCRDSETTEVEASVSKRRRATVV